MLDLLLACVFLGHANQMVRLACSTKPAVHPTAVASAYRVCRGEGSPGPVQWDPLPAVLPFLPFDPVLVLHQKMTAVRSA